MVTPVGMSELLARKILLGKIDPYESRWKIDEINVTELMI